MAREASGRPDHPETSGGRGGGLLLSGCRILLPNRTVGEGDVRIEGGAISEIGSGLDPAGCEVRRLRGALVMPGLFNAHGHTAMTLLRGLGGGLPLDRWLREAIFPVEARLSPEDVEAGVRWGVVEMLAGGTVCVADMYDFADAGMRAFAGAGFKANVCCVGRDAPGRLRECIDFTRRHGGGLGRGGIVADLCVHSEYLTDEPFCRELAAANRDMGRPLHVHASETRREHEECVARHGKTPIAYLADTGLFDHGGYAAHCVWATDDDFRIMRERGVTLVHSPSSNMKLGSGFARVASAMSIGVNVALGTDGCASNDNLNLFEEMHLAALVHKGVSLDPAALSAWDVIEMATANGAKALGRTDSGAVAEGMRADLCVVDLDRPHLLPSDDVPGLVAYSAQASDVVMTIVDGRVLFDAGRYPTIDVARAKADFLAAARRLGRRG